MLLGCFFIIFAFEGSFLDFGALFCFFEVVFGLLGCFLDLWGAFCFLGVFFWLFCDFSLQVRSVRLRKCLGGWVSILGGGVHAKEVP